MGMTSIGKISVGSILLLVLLAGLYFGYQSYRQFNQPRYQAVRAVPSGSLAFFETDDMTEAIYSLSHADFWEAFQSVEELKNLEARYLELDSLLRKNYGFNELLQNDRVICAIYPVRPNKLTSFFIVELPASYDGSDILNFIEDKIGSQSLIMKTTYRDASVFAMNLPKLDKIFYFSVFRGLLIAGFNRDVIQYSIDELYTPNPLSNQASFQHLRSTAGKNVVMNLYVRFPALISNLSSKSNLALADIFERMHGLGDWSETDLIVHPDNLLLNGYTVAPDSLKTGLAFFKQAPGLIRVPDILPYNVSWMIHYSFENFQAYLHSRRKDSVFSIEMQNFENRFTNGFDADITHDFVDRISGACAVAEIASSASQPKSQLVILQTKDVLGAVIGLERIAQKINRKKAIKAWQKSYQEFSIKLLNVENLFRPIFGRAFPDFEKNYYIAIKDYLVFSDNPQVLIYLLKHYYARNTLAEDANYKEFSNNISDKSNIYLYTNIQRSIHQIPTLFNPASIGDASAYVSALGNFEALALQFSYINQMFYTNLFLKYNPDYQEVIPDSWDRELTRPLAGKPYLVPNHRSGKLNVLIADTDHHLYLLDHVGNIQWDKGLSGEIMGEIHPIDFYGNGKLQYLFNTQNFIYLVDVNGRDVEDYPQALPAKATSPLAVFDYNKDGDYRVLIGLEDMRIYNFDKRGNQVEGWNKIKSRSAVIDPVQHLVDKDKDYLFVTDENGRVLICDRRGNERIHLKKGFIRGKHTAFYRNQTNNKGAFISTDQEGRLVYIGLDGQIQFTPFGNFPPDYFFAYRDADHNGSADFIFQNGNKLQIFDRFKKIIFENNFPEIINSEPMYYQSGGRLILGFLLPASGEIRLYTWQGRLFENRLLKGDTPFSIGSIQGDLKLNLVTGMGNRVINYSLSVGE